MVEMGDVVEKLLERTTEGQVPWKPTADESTFAASFGSMSLLISTHERQAVLGKRTEYKLSVSGESVLDEKGYEIESAVYTAEFSSGILPLSDVYRLAKRQALKIDERLQELVTLLGDSPPDSTP